MDISSLFDQLRPADDQDRARKQEAVAYSHSLRRNHGSDNSTPPELLANVFGGPSEDFYFTALLTTMSRHQAGIDPFWAAVLNKAALQLTFQTREFIGTHSNDLFVYEGDDSYFNIALANTNAVHGVLITAEPAPPPVPWGASTYPHIENKPKQTFTCHLEHLSVILDRLRHFPVPVTPVGCLVVDLWDDARFDVAERYHALADSVDAYTTYALRGPAEAITSAVEGICSTYPGARAMMRAYELQGRSVAVLVVDSVSKLPRLQLGAHPS